jgi:Domain of unknown function (DUF6973)
MRPVILNLFLGISAAGVVAFHKANTRAELGLPGRITFWDVVDGVRYYSDLPVILNSMNYAATEAGRRYPNEPDDLNGCRNAFKHACWAAILTAEIGDTEARIITKNHESWRGNPKLDREMDGFNNDAGHKLGLHNPKASWCALSNLSQSHVVAGKLLIISDERLVTSDQPIKQSRQNVQRWSHLGDPANIFGITQQEH